MSEDLENDKLPKQELLIKILKMTTSDNDNQALVAIRKANAFLADNKWDWEKLINAKIKIAADPFANLTTPAQNPSFAYSRPAPPSRPRPQAPPPPPPPRAPQPQPTPRQPPPPPKAKIDSTRTNQYAGWCYCCGDPVDAKAGWIFNPHHHRVAAKDKWQIVCHTCNQMPFPTIGPSAMPRKRQAAGFTPSVNDLKI